MIINKRYKRKGDAKSKFMRVKMRMKSSQSSRPTSAVPLHLWEIKNGTGDILIKIYRENNASICENTDAFTLPILIVGGMGLLLDTEERSGM